MGGSKHAMKVAVSIAAAILLTCMGCSYNGRLSDTRWLHPDDPDSLGGTGIESVDVRSVAERMARSLLDVLKAKESGAKPVIVVLPVRNRTRFRVDTALFTDMIRDILIEHASDKAVFLIGKDVGGPVEKFEKADFHLRGDLRAISKSSPRGISDWVYFSFQLIDKGNGAIVWSRRYEKKAEGQWGVVYQ